MLFAADVEVEQKVVETVIMIAFLYLRASDVR